MWSFIKIAIALLLIFIGGSCTASRHMNNHVSACDTELQFTDRMRDSSQEDRKSLANELHACVQDKFGFPENLFALF